MGSIQGSINSMIGTTAVAIGAGKKLSTDAKALEVNKAKTELDRINTQASLDKENLEIGEKEVAIDDSLKGVQQDVETKNQALTDAFNNPHPRDEGGRFTNKKELLTRLENDLDKSTEALMNVQKEQKAIQAQRELFNKRKEMMAKIYKDKGGIN